MSSDTIRNQIGSAVLSLMSDSIFYAYCRYSKQATSRGTFIAKITKEQYLMIQKKFTESQGSDNTVPVNHLIPTLSGSLVTMYAVASNTNDNALLPFQVVEIYRIATYSQLDTVVDPLTVNYLKEIIVNDVNEVEQLENKAVSLAVSQANANLNQNQALTLFGAEGLELIKNALANQEKPS